MTKIANISTGPRGAYNDGALVMAEVGEVIEADDFSDEWFVEEKPKAQPKVEAKVEVKAKRK
jgi:hypothetical protein